jgi:hypothetical protein
VIASRIQHEDGAKERRIEEMASEEMAAARGTATKGARKAVGDRPTKDLRNAAMDQPM